MNYGYEYIQYDRGVPFHVFINYLNEIPEHWHQEMELLMVVRGKAKIIIEGQINEMSEGDLILINGNTLHKTISDLEDHSVIVGIQMDIHYFASFLENFDKKCFLLKSFLHGKYMEKRFNVIRQTMARIILLMSSGIKEHMLIVQSLVGMLCYYVNENIEYVEASELMNVTKREYARIVDVMNHIKEHYNEKLTLESIAEEVHISKYHLSHSFKKQVGIGLKKYIQNIRMDMAINKMLHSSDNITDVIMNSGFSSLHSFYRLFSEKYGCVPSEFLAKRKAFNLTVGEDALSKEIIEYLSQYITRGDNLDQLMGPDIFKGQHRFINMLHKSDKV